MSKLLRTFTLLALLLLLASPALAQGRLIYHDDAGRLDRARVERAAGPLLDRGAVVAVYTVASGNETDFADRLEQDGLASSGSVNANMVAIYVSFNPRYSAIRYGDRWNAALGVNNNVEAIRTGQLNVGLAASDVTGGFVNALSAIDQAIKSPPTAGGGTNVTVESGTFTPVVLGVIFLVLLLVGGPLLYRSYKKRRTIAQAFAQARQSAEDARRQAGGVIADMGQAIKDARDKAAYDKVSYAAADVEQLRQWQSAAEAQFTKAQEQFDHIAESLAAKRVPTKEDYQSVAKSYAGVTQQVETARRQLAQAEARRVELDRISADAPGNVDRAKKALADAAEQLGALGDELTQPQAILRPLEAQVAQAERLLAERRAADAITAAQAASAAIDELSQILTTYADIREGITTGRAAAEKAAAQGYRVEAGLEAFTTAESLLGQSLRALEQNGPAAARPLLDQADAARAQGVARGGGMPALRRANDERLQAIEEIGRQIDAAIAEGRRTFDIVDEFAESTWSDIRGNGSEAEASVARARALWERAAQRNSMETQDFLGAKEDLAAADQQIAAARGLLDSIIQRLKDLEAARDVARQEIAAAQDDMKQGWSFVHAHDPDIGKVPEDLLTRADALLQQAAQELAQTRPDWLAVVRYAQGANRLADEALTGARDEVDAMARLRDQVARAQQIATAEVQKIVQFAALHSNDIAPAQQRKLAALQADVQAAYAALQSTQQKEEHARAAALREALDRYTALRDTADRLYTEIYGAFQQLEKLRKRVAKASEQSAQAITHAEQLVRTYDNRIPANSEGRKLLAQAQADFASIGVIRNEKDAQRGLAAAEQSQQKAERAKEIFREQVPASRPGAGQGHDVGDFVTGMVIGALLNSGGDSGSSSSDSGWGGGGGSGGDWGGGGGSGGSWGGGGGSGGGW